MVLNTRNYAPSKDIQSTPTPTHTKIILTSTKPNSPYPPAQHARLSSPNGTNSSPKHAHPNLSPLPHHPPNPRPLKTPPPSQPSSPMLSLPAPHTDCNAPCASLTMISSFSSISSNQHTPTHSASQTLSSSNAPSKPSFLLTLRQAYTSPTSTPTTGSPLTSATTAKITNYTYSLQTALPPNLSPTHTLTPFSATTAPDTPSPPPPPSYPSKSNNRKSASYPATFTRNADHLQSHSQPPLP